MQIGLHFLREDMGSPTLNRGLPVDRQSSEGRHVSSEGNICEASCQSLPLFSQISQNFNLEPFTLEYPLEMDLTLQNVACLQSPALVGYWRLSKQDDIKEKGLDLPLCWEPHQRMGWKSCPLRWNRRQEKHWLPRWNRGRISLGPWQLHGLAQKTPGRLNTSNVPHRLGRPPFQTEVR